MVKVLHLRKSRKDADQMSQRGSKSRCEFHRTVCILLISRVLDRSKYFSVVAEKLHLAARYWCTSTIWKGAVKLKVNVKRERENMRLDPAERRGSPRIRLQIPIFMRAVDSSGAEFLELSKTLDISATGAFLACTRLLRMDQSVSLTIPAPSPSSSGMPPETPPIIAKVKREHPAGGVHLLGVQFLKPLN